MKSLRTKRVIRKLMPFCHNLSSSSYWLNSSGIFIIRINIRWHSLLRNGKQIASHFGVIVLLRIVPIFYVAVAVLHICVMSSRQKLLKWFMIIKQHYKFLNSLQETIVRLCNMLQTRLHSVVWLSFQKGKKKNGYANNYYQLFKFIRAPHLPKSSQWRIRKHLET